jgi:O-antigen/teichoic acid export membrane protein
VTEHPAHIKPPAEPWAETIEQEAIVEPVEPLLEPLHSWRGLVRRFGVLAVGEGFAQLCGFVAVIIMARKLDPHGFGLVTLGTTLVVWFALFADSGTEVLNIRDISRRPDHFKRLAEPVLGLRLALSVIAIALLGCAAILASDRTSDRYVLWLFALCLPMLALNLRWMVLGVRGAKSVALGNVAGRLLLMVGVILFVHSVGDTLVVPVLLAGAELVYAMVVLAAVTRRFGIIRPRVDVAKWRETLEHSWPLMLNQLARATVYSFDILLVAIMLGREEVGFYGAAAKPVLFLSGALGLFYISFLTSYSTAGSRHAGPLFRRTVTSATAATTIVAAIVAAAAPLIVVLFYGHAYDDAALPLAVLVFSIPALAVGGAYGVALIAGHRQAALMRNNVAGAVFNIAGNLVAIPLFGIAGAAAVTVASELLNLVLNYRSAVRGELAPSFSEIIGRRSLRPVAAHPPEPAAESVQAPTQGAEPTRPRPGALIER